MVNYGTGRMLRSRIRDYRDLFVSKNGTALVASSSDVSGCLAAYHHFFVMLPQ
jgi:hypothetical protein